MSELESSFRRWLRLKGEATTARPPESAGLETTCVETAATGPEAFDPASLPSIDSITAATNIGAFLQPGVSPELTVAALRRAWTSDPTIRNFVGIADNQWDFNDPNGIFGFGRLDAVEGGVTLHESPAANQTETPDVAAKAAAHEIVTGEVDDVERARAQEYALLATLLLRSPDAELLSRLDELTGDESPIGLAHAALGAAAARVNVETVAREYSNLFVGIREDSLLPYASIYLGDSLYGRPLARLREALQSLGIEAAQQHSEPEDHAAILCEIMAGLAQHSIPAPAGFERAFFQAHVSPWMKRFFVDLERAKAADFYAVVGLLGRNFMDLETEAFSHPE